MPLDAIIISSPGSTSLAESSSMKLQLDGETATIQHIRALLSGCDTRESDPQTMEKHNWHHVPKLSGMALFNYLSAKGYRCDLIDSLDAQIDRFRDLMAQRPAYVILSTSFIYNKAMFVQVVSQVRQFARETILVVGGPFVYSSYLLLQRRQDSGYDTVSPENDFLFLSSEEIAAVDYYIIGGQGLSQLSDLMDGRPPEEISGLGYHTDKGLRINPPPADAEYEKISIAWHQLPPQLLTNQVMPLQASNGCPFHCRFCNFVKDPRATFVRPIDDIVADLKQLQSLGVRYVRFVDDNFRLGKRDLEQVCKRFIKEGITIRWLTFLRAASLADVDMALLAQAGCTEVQLGLESAHPDVLREMNKESDPETYYRVIKSLLHHGINVATTFIIGFPGETAATAQTTIDFIKSIDFEDAKGLYFWWVFPFMLAPLSPIYEQCEREKYGLQGYMHQWRHNTMDSSQAREIIRQACFEIENSSPGYSADNLELMLSLSPEKRKQFMLTRHQLAKRALTQSITKAEIARAFSGLF